MLPLDNAEVVALMRAHAEKRRQRRMRPLLVLAVAGSIAMWLGVCVAFGIRIEPAPATTKFGGASWLIGFVFASTGAVYFGYPSVPPDVSRLVEQLRVRVVD